MRRFVRFRSCLRDPAAPSPLGIFRAAGELIEAEALDPWSASRVEEICAWFNRHLIAPKLGPNLRRAVFWFRADCGHMITALWELAIIMRERGTDIEFIQTSRPGLIRYADDYQIAAIPWRR
jgi:hypothetical protein